MDFSTYPTLYTTLRDKASPGLRDLATFHSKAMADMVAQGDPIGPKQVDAEYHRLQDSRPYYHLYPGILRPLLNLALDLDTGANLPDHASANFGIQIPRPLITDCVRLCATLCLLADDPEIIEADVLNKDRQKYLNSRDDKYVEKAHRRGKVGWLVGRDLEKSPHYRRGHFALFWTGAGRHIPKVGWRKGTVVHRDQVVKVPTGEMG